jgi:hypothetical protein
MAAHPEPMSISREFLSANQALSMADGKSALLRSGAMTAGESAANGMAGWMGWGPPCSIPWRNAI